MTPTLKANLATIRTALYSGQISAAKVDGQRALEAVIAELGEEGPATHTTASCGKFGFCQLVAGHDGKCLNWLQVERLLAEANK